MMEYPKKLSGRYEILSQIGAGGMAKVFMARDLNLQRSVALKILHEDLIEDPEFRARFLQEARSAANLAHPNIVTIFDFGHDSGSYYFVMEYVHGTDLKSLMRRKVELPLDHALDLMVQICAGVGYAHRAGLVHCDLKPQNILVSADGVAKITDFGIAQALATIEPDETSETVWGSPRYFAPEQAAGQPPTPASDVYSLGIILYELTTGKLPFDAEQAEALAEMHQTALPETPRTVNPLISPPLERIILKVLSKEPATRYRTADQLGRVLESIVYTPRPYTEAEPDLPTAPVEPKEQVDWIAIALGLASLLAVGGLIPLWLWVWLLYQNPR
jgi:serine/threonine-protein kinase